MLGCILAAQLRDVRIVARWGMTRVNVDTRVNIVPAALAAQYALDGLRTSALLGAPSS